MLENGDRIALDTQRPQIELDGTQRTVAGVDQMTAFRVFGGGAAADEGATQVRRQVDYGNFGRVGSTGEDDREQHAAATGQDGGKQVISFASDRCREWCGFSSP